MYRVIVYVSGEDHRTYEFLEESRASARLRAEELAQQGFWLEDSDPIHFIPPVRIQLIQISRDRRSNQTPTEHHEPDNTSD